MIKESEFKNKLLSNLRLINDEWIDGDLECVDGKKADLVNHKLKVVIEIKDDLINKTIIPKMSGEMIGQTFDLRKMNQQYTDKIRSANKKFNNYPGYKTILILRTDLYNISGVIYSISGLDTYRKVSGDLVYVGKTTKYNTYIRKNIGCYLFINDKFVYVNNLFADEVRKVSKEQAEEILGVKLD